MVALAVTGQIAWAVENTWFNTFVFDTISPDPRPVSWMVAASAIIATLTTILMGTLSDRTRSRWGRRKPYILFGYILWGLMTALFPMTAMIRNVSLAIIMVVVLDCLMTFFGSTANDAAFNAWTVDVAPAAQRGKVEGVLNLSLFIAQLVAIVAAGALIDSVGYFTFFYVLGGIVMVVGLLAGGVLPDEPSVHLPRSEKGLWQEIRELFRLDTLRENTLLFIILISAMLLGIGFQVAFPYMIVYINNYIGVSKTEYAIVGGAVIIGSAIAAIPLGILAVGAVFAGMVWYGPFFGDHHKVTQFFHMAGAEHETAEGEAAPAEHGTAPVEQVATKHEATTHEAAAPAEGAAPAGAEADKEAKARCSAGPLGWIAIQMAFGLEQGLR